MCLINGNLSCLLGFYFRLMSNLCSYSSSIAKDYVMKLSCGANYYVNLTNGKRNIGKRSNLKTDVTLVAAPSWLKLVNAGVALLWEVGPRLLFGGKYGLRSRLSNSNNFDCSKFLSLSTCIDKNIELKYLYLSSQQLTAYHKQQKVYNTIEKALF